MAGGMKRLAKETAVYGLSSIVGRFLNWMLVPMYTRVLAGTGDYGIVTNLYGWTALAYLWHGDGFFPLHQQKRGARADAGVCFRAVLLAGKFGAV